MAFIALTQGQRVAVDDEDWFILNLYKWAARKDCNTYYAERMSDTKNGRRSSIKMHRLIMGVVNPKIMVDHIDGNGLNNSKSNLRLCSNSQNQANRKSKMGRSKYKGVVIQRNKYNARVQTKGKLLHTGTFPLTPCGELLAAVSYDIKAQEVFGEFASFNFPLI